MKHNFITKTIGAIVYWCGFLAGYVRGFWKGVFNIIRNK